MSRKSPELNLFCKTSVMLSSFGEVSKITNSSNCLGWTADSEQKVSDSAHSHAAAPGVGSSQSKGSNFYLTSI